MTDPLSVVRDYYAGFNDRDATVHDRVYASDALIVGPGVPGFEMRGREVARALDTGFWKAFPDCHITILDALAEGEIVLTRNQFTGTHGGPLQTPMGDMPATGRLLDRDYATCFRVVDGRIAEFRLYYDRIALLDDLGLMPQPEGAAVG